MKLGINLLCLAGHIDESHLPYLQRLAEIGFDHVEVPVMRGSPDHYAWLGGQLAALGLGRAQTSIVPDVDANPLSGDASVRQCGLDHLSWIQDCAEALGSETVGGPFHAPIGHFTGQGPTEAEIERGVSAHRNMSERAARGGYKLALEHLNRFETYFLNTMDQARAYADRVDHPAFGIMYDTFHANIEERDQPAAIAHLGDRMHVLHVSENDRGVPGRGQIDFAAVFRAAKAAGFDGHVVVEAFGAGLPELAAATRVWRPLFPDFETLFTESHDFIRRTWEAA
ncbi:MULTISPECIES: sugar phosphate isomerase/epimerase family protein [Mameliella]|uniref:sugar phosphate isomerase/epimerase family protein n=1 Tax=Mameliella TaxID=1434019 RepID=UPI000B529C2E|nr:MULTISPECIES: sugar phosphate isomerase/epimerase family protein [Mameliella]MCR9272456.1 sugar phosphate isomerase/epimerase [Paracoccaceae bacterium]OWV61871.1 isomerase [Mameliella alba]